jgi:glycosyltransferase involved in cell wall biosynthesis
MRVVVIGATPHSLINFRGELIKKLIASSCEVITMAGEATEADIATIESYGANFVSYPVSRSSAGPLNNLKTFFAFRKALKRYEPDIVLSYTIKPVIWTGIALLGVKKARFNALITGLGYAFEGGSLKRRLLQKIVSALYWLSLVRADKIIFQNEDDQNYFLATGLAKTNKTCVVNGSGVPIDYFSQQPFLDSRGRGVSFLMIARLLNEKGVRYFIEAAQKVKSRFPDARFELLGPYDTSPDGIGEKEVSRWVRSGNVEYLGESDDVRPFLMNCDVFVLPSFYREGLPRTILEAMSTGRPILTTNNVGCRDPIQEGYNGWLVPVKDAESLAAKMTWYIENAEKISEMGNNSRSIVIEKYDVNLVNEAMLDIMGVNVV